MRRLPVPTTRTTTQSLEHTAAYFDPALTWAPERAVLPNDAVALTPAEFRGKLGPHTLLIAGCHGEAGVSLSETLLTTSQERVLTAADLLTQPLTGSVVVLEACWAGRYLGHRSGEQLTIATAALLAGATAVVAALFAVPADDRCTPQIAASTFRELRAGTNAAEALRRARAR